MGKGFTLFQQKSVQWQHTRSIISVAHVQQFFPRGRGNCTHTFITVLVQKTHINPIFIVQNQGIIGAKYFITLGKTARSRLSWIRGAGFLFADHSSMTWPHLSSIILTEVHKTYINSMCNDTNLRNRSNIFYFSGWGRSNGKGWRFCMAELLVHT